MELLERIWEIVSGILGGALHGFERGITSLFGSANARYLKKLQSKVDAIGALEPKYQAMSDEELGAQTELFRKRLSAGETVDDLLVETFALCREAGVRWLGMRLYDVQMLGGIILHSGAIAEMVTGEGKTLVATMPVYLNALEDKGVHVVTVNDYLARRDMEWMGPLYIGLGLSVGAIQSGMETAERQQAYACDITYGTNNEFGFDYLRDNMRPAARGDERFPKYQQQSQGPLHYAVIDEVDNILIDEARTPLIISGAAQDDVTKYAKADTISRQLVKDKHFEVKEKEHTANLTDEGIREAERLAGVESFYTAGNMQWPHLIDNSLKAHYLYKLDVNYVVQGDEVVIVDEFTGRLMPGRNWSDGLHQAVEAKERVRIKEENQTLATITLQNFFKLYSKISGMTGTAMTEAGEFWKIYKLDVIAVPTNRPMKRDEHPDLIYRTEKEKYVALVEEIERHQKWDEVELTDGTTLHGTIVEETDEGVKFRKDKSKQTETIPAKRVRRLQRKGRPILVGTVSIEKSERVSDQLKRRGIKHEVLNAKNHTREAEIIAQAGRLGSVTIATNMAGRGTDIVLGGNPESMAWAELQEKYETRLDVPRQEWDDLVRDIREREGMKAEGAKVESIGGLYIIGTERHESRRIDLQLRGRSGRQGDAGSSRFFLSLEDDLMRIFAGEWVKNILTRLGMQDGEAIESRMVTRRVEGAQKKVEERNFEIRKNLLEYDEVMDEQRKRVYGYRQKILDGTNCKHLIVEMIESQIEHNLSEFLNPNYGAETFAKWASKLFTMDFESRAFRGLDYANAGQFLLDEAERMAETQVLDAIEENLPAEADQGEWNWEAMAKMANTRWRLSIRDRDLKKVGRDHLAEMLIEKAQAAILKIDTSDGEPFLDEQFGVRTACGWLKHKFDIDLDFDEVRELEPGPFISLTQEKARAIYEDREIEFPVMVGLSQFSRVDAGGSRRYDREKIVLWAADRFGVQFDMEDLRSKQRDEIRQLLIDHSRTNQHDAKQALDEAQRRLGKVFGGSSATSQTAGDVGGNGAIASLSDWLDATLDCQLSAEEIAPLDRDELEHELEMAVETRYRPEIRRMERFLLLELVDNAWKEHLLAMDHLRSSIGLRGYAQVDPKVEYKREGMRMFDEMWQSVGDRTTDLVFRMEELDEELVGSTFVESQAIHEDASGAAAMDAQQQAGDGISTSDEKQEPIRNREQRVGRNEPCPCGSGKKFKNCCMRKRVA